MHQEPRNAAHQETSLATLRAKYDDEICDGITGNGVKRLGDVLAGE
jgi:hypothetical protein